MDFPTGIIVVTVITFIAITTSFIPLLHSYLSAVRMPMMSGENGEEEVESVEEGRREKGSKESRHLQWAR